MSIPPNNSPAVQSQGAATPAVVDERPQHLIDAEAAGVDTGMQLLSQYVVPPRIKIVQPQSTDKFKQKFNEGDVILTPLMQAVASVELNSFNKPGNVGGLFTFCPIFFFPEWYILNPYEMRGKVPMISERTFDPKSRIAHRASNPGLRYEDMIDSVSGQPLKDAQGKNTLQRRYVAAMNYIVCITSVDELRSTPVVLSFNKANYNAGTYLAGLMAARNTKVMHSLQFAARSNKRPSETYNYFGIDAFNVDAPMDPWIRDPEWFRYYGDLNQQFRETYQAGLLQTTYDDEDDDAIPATAGASVDC